MRQEVIPTETWCMGEITFTIKEYIKYMDMKRIAAIVLALLMMTVFAACGNDEPSPTPAPTPTPMVNMGQVITGGHENSEIDDSHAMPDPKREDVCLLMRIRTRDLAPDDEGANYVMVYYGLGNSELYLSAIYGGEEHEILLHDSEYRCEEYAYLPKIMIRDMDGDGCNEIIFMSPVTGMGYIRLSLIEVYNGELRETARFDDISAMELEELGFEKEIIGKNAISLRHERLSHDIQITAGDRISAAYDDPAEAMWPKLAWIKNAEIDPADYNGLPTMTVEFALRLLDATDLYYHRFYITFSYDTESDEYVMIDAYHIYHNRNA